MWRYTEGIDFVLLTDRLKFERVVALVTIKYEQLTRASIPCVRNKVL